MMIFGLEVGESTILVVRRHWFIIAVQALIFFIIALFPVVAYRFIPFGPLLDLVPGDVSLLLSFLYGIWFLLVWTMFFIFWTDYYLDYWVVTDKRIVDVEQKGLFARDVSSVRLDKIQDIKVEVNGLFATILGYGDIKVESAGETEKFILSTIPHPYRVKDIITSQYSKALDRLQTVHLEK